MEPNETKQLASAEVSNAVKAAQAVAATVPEVKPDPVVASKEVPEAPVAPNGHHCAFEGCDRKPLAFGLCWTHYQQQRRGKDLTPIRKRGMKMLPGNVRVESSVYLTLQQRVTNKQAVSMYEAVRQAILAGIEYWSKGGK